MKSLYNIYEGVLADINDTLSKSDDNVGTLSELAEARKLKFEPDKKDSCSVMFNCPILLNKCLDLKVRHKIASKKLGRPTSLQLCYGYDSERNYYNITIRIHNERKYCTCLYATSQWDYSNKATSAEIANKIFKYMLKSEEHFKLLLSVFDSNHISYKSSYNLFEAPYFSPKSLMFGLQRL